MLTIYVAADTLISLQDAALASNGASLEAGTVTWELLTPSGDSVDDATGTLDYVSPGLFQGILSSSVALTPGATYFLEVTATAGESQGFWRCECVAAYQDESNT